MKNLTNHTNDTPQPSFEWEGQLTEDAAADLAEQVGFPRSVRGQASISLPFRDPSAIAVNRRDVFPLADLLVAQKETLPAPIQLQITQFDFYQVNLVCTFQPARGCRFSNAQFALTLRTLSSVIPAPGDAIAYDLIPDKVEDQMQVSVKLSLDMGPKLTTQPISAELSAGVSAERTKEYVRYFARVQSYILDGTNPAWKFERTNSHELDGSYSLFMLVRKPKGTQVQIMPTLTANVQFMLGSLPLDPRPLVFHRKNRKPELVDQPFLLL